MRNQFCLLLLVVALLLSLPWVDGTSQPQPANGGAYYQQQQQQPHHQQPITGTQPRDSTDQDAYSSQQGHQSQLPVQQQQQQQLPPRPPQYSQYPQGGSGIPPPPSGRYPPPPTSGLPQYPPSQYQPPIHRRPLPHQFQQQQQGGFLSK